MRSKTNQSDPGRSQIQFNDQFSSLNSTAPTTSTKPVKSNVNVEKDIQVEILTSNIENLSILSLSTSKIGIILAGSIGIDLLSQSIVKSLVSKGIDSNNINITIVDEVIALPYYAKKISKLNNIVIASSVLLSGKDSESIASITSNSLIQLGLSIDIPIIPAIILRNSLLELKSILPTFSSSWSNAAVSLLELQIGDSIKTNIATPPIIEIEKKVTKIDSTVTSINDLLNHLRDSLASHGARGIIGFGRKFRIIDDDNSGTINLNEFTKAINEHALTWTLAQVKLVFDYFDTDKSNSISYDEFLKGVRGDMIDRRKQLVLLAFQILDSDKSGIVDINDIKKVYNADKHPDVICGLKSSEEILSMFLDTFDSNSDGEVTPKEFIDYYSNISASIDNDDYFELMIRNAWHISGGEGWCENSSNRRVLVTHTDGHQSVREIKNDLGINANDKDKMMENLINQGINDIVSIDVAGSKSESASVAQPVTAPVTVVTLTPPQSPTKSKDTQIRPSTPVIKPIRAKGAPSSIFFG